MIDEKRLTGVSPAFTLAQALHLLLSVKAMKTYFLINNAGQMIGWIDAVDENSAKAIVASHKYDNVSMSPYPIRDWYVRRQPLQETDTQLLFAV